MQLYNTEQRSEHTLTIDDPFMIGSGDIAGLRIPDVAEVAASITVRDDAAGDSVTCEVFSHSGNVSVLDVSKHTCQCRK